VLDARISVSIEPSEDILGRYVEDSASENQNIDDKGTESSANAMLAQQDAGLTTWLGTIQCHALRTVENCSVLSNQYFPTYHYYCDELLNNNFTQVDVTLHKDQGQVRDLEKVIEALNAEISLLQSKLAAAADMPIEADPRFPVPEMPTIVALTRI
jgi:hypothetical protein